MATEKRNIPRTHLRAAGDGTRTVCGKKIREFMAVDTKAKIIDCKSCLSLFETHGDWVVAG